MNQWTRKGLNSKSSFPPFSPCILRAFSLLFFLFYSWYATAKNSWENTRKTWNTDSIIVLLCIPEFKANFLNFKTKGKKKKKKKKTLKKCFKICLNFFHNTCMNMAFLVDRFMLLLKTFATIIARIWLFSLDHVMLNRKTFATGYLVGQKRAIRKTFADNNWKNM